MAETTEVTYSITHKFNMGNYEMVTVTASMTVRPKDGEDGYELLEIARDEIADFLKPDIERALESTGEEESYGDTWLHGPRQPVGRKKHHR